MSADVYMVREAVRALPTTCRYHGAKFGASGYLGPAEGGVPRCESCRAPWRRMCALAAIERVIVRVRRPAVAIALESDDE